MGKGGLIIDISPLKMKLKFPVTAYVKENGFLGMVSYNPDTDDFFITSKSSPDSDFSAWLKAMFFENVKDAAGLKEYLKQKNVTMVFECVDMENDPHIIKYDKSHLFLLDIVKNQLKYEKLPYQQLVQISKVFGFEVKTRAYQFMDWQSFRNWYTEIMDEEYLYDGKHIEGFVVEDNTGYMVKFKCYYYHLWKHMRSVAQEVFRSGQYRRMGSLLTPLENKFYGFCKEIRDQEHPNHIIPLRDMFMQQLIESK